MTKLRRLVWALRWLRRLGVAVAVVATLMAGEAIIRTEPDYNATVAAFLYSGRTGEWVTVGDARVMLVNVRGAAKVKPVGNIAADTTGVWIVVTMRVEAVHKTTNILYAALYAADGRTFHASGRFRQSIVTLNGAVDLQPGIPMQGDVAFEVPKDVTGLALVVGTNASLEQPLQDLYPYTDIPLPMTDADLARWAGDPGPLAIDEPKAGE